MVPRWLRHLPNFISSIRILLIVPIAFTLAQHRWNETLWIFAVAAVSDAVDGYLARHFGWQTELGGVLDPIADKLMIATVFIMLAVLGAVPVWLTASVLARDLIIVTGAVCYRIWIGPVVAHPTFISKLNTLCQLLFVIAQIGTLQFAGLPRGLTVGLGALVLVTLVISGLDYVLVYGSEAIGRFRVSATTRAVRRPTVP